MGTVQTLSGLIGGDLRRAAAIVAAAYAAVLLTELAADRSLFAITSLSARFTPGAIFAGAMPAYGLKMAAAMLVAGLVSQLPPWAAALISGATWLFAAWAVWRPEGESANASRFASLRRPSLVAFTSIALTEWGDPGQLAVALLSIRFHAPLLVWCGAMAALLTKTCAALLVGITARRYISERLVRVAAALFCVINAVVVEVQLLRGMA